MFDEIPAPPTADGLTDAWSATDAWSGTDRSLTTDDSALSRTDTDDCSRDGVDPPERGDRDRSADDEERGPERTEYRLERLRLVRSVVTLAVVVARLIRSV